MVVVVVVVVLVVVVVVVVLSLMYDRNGKTSTLSITA